MKMGKGNSSKVNETQGFLNLGHSSWPIWSLLNRERKEERPGAENGKREMPKSE